MVADAVFRECGAFIHESGTPFWVSVTQDRIQQAATQFRVLNMFAGNQVLWTFVDS